MTDAQKRFCDEYLIDLNATRAYKVAYASCKKDETARANSSRMLTNANIKEYIKKKQEDIQKITEITQEKVIQELAAIAFSNATEFATVKGNRVKIKNTDNLEEGVKKAIVGIKKGKNGIEIKSADKVQALELLGRHLGIFNDKLNVNVKEKEEKKNAITDILSQMQSVDDV